MTNSPSTFPDAEKHLSDAKLAAIPEGGGSTLVENPAYEMPGGRVRRKIDVTLFVLRLGCLLTSITSLSMMVTAKQSTTISIMGFSFPIYAKWTLSDSFEYLVGVSAAVAAHCLLQMVVTTSWLLQKHPVIPSRKHAWLIFAGDQIFAYAMMSAGSAASGVINLNRVGIRHTASFPNFCKPLHIFCNHIAASIVLAFISCFLLVASTIVDVIWLSNY